MSVFGAFVSIYQPCRNDLTLTATKVSKAPATLLFPIFRRAYGHPDAITGLSIISSILLFSGIINKRLTYSALTGSELPQTC